MEIRGVFEMSKRKKKLYLIGVASAMVGFYGALEQAYLCGRGGEWFLYGLFLALSVVLGTCCAILPICMKVDEVYEKLKRLFEQSQSYDNKE
jgi:hypothetical protein